VITLKTINLCYALCGVIKGKTRVKYNFLS